MTNYITIALAALCLFLGCLLLWQRAYVKEQAGIIAVLEQDKATAIAANRQANATITGLQRAANATAAITIDWTGWSQAVQSAGKDAALAIEGVKDATEILDAVLPVDIGRNLDRLREQAVSASGQRSQDGRDSSTGALSPATANTANASRSADAAQAGSVGSGIAGDPGAKRER